MVCYIGARALTELKARISAENRHEFLHAPIKVPRHQAPFSTPDEMAQFNTQVLNEIAAGNIPDGYLVTDEEWEDEEYPNAEAIPVGRASKQLEIALPAEIWRPRAVLWAQAVEILGRLIPDPQSSHSDSD
ncbi:hypothetical protein EUX98_g8601 [Antrodiella citrinella]|uniref:Uncharacterized protein n=1 Tax=Antrodiella citrinella TaxID=2447956 RepID=A0A4S4M581_9APHY|nr:hypothetical protein EUX98_g8601 [Antrodiella citrinella]